MLRRLPQPGPEANDRHLFATPRRRELTEFPVDANHPNPPPVAGERIKVRDDFPSGDRWEQMFEMFEQLQNGMGALAEQLWSRIPTWILEWGYLPSATVVSSSDAYNNATVAGTGATTGGGISTLAAQTSDLEYITTVVTLVPASETGLLTLGKVTMPVPTGLTTMPFVRFPLEPLDLRQLSISGSPGGLGLWLFGEVAPTRGRLPL